MTDKVCLLRSGKIRINLKAYERLKLISPFLFGYCLFFDNFAQKFFNAVIVLFCECKAQAGVDTVFKPNQSFLRFYNLSDRIQYTKLYIVGKYFDISFGAFEVKSFVFNGEELDEQAELL